MSTRKSLLYSFLDRYVALFVSVLSSMVLARLLTPAEIGVYSLTVVLLLYVSVIRDMGAGQYLVQVKELTTERIRAVWCVQLGLGWLIALAVLLASVPVAHFYNEPRMKTILWVVALNYAVTPFGSLTYAWLMREMRFKPVALMRAVSAIAGAVVSVTLAWKGAGPISLALGTLASTVASALLAVILRPRGFPWLPGVSEIRNVLHFGSRITGSSVLEAVSNSAPELLLGKLQSLTAVGLYSRANGLVTMYQRLFIDAVATVCVPWFASQQRERGAIAEPFAKAVEYISVLGWSFCLVVLFLAHPMVRVLYGDQWDGAVSMVRLMSLAMMFSVPSMLCTVALMSSGGVGRLAPLALFNTLTTVACISAGAWSGHLEAVGWALVLAAAVNSVRMLRATLKHIQLPVRNLLQGAVKGAFAAGCAGAVPALVFVVFGATPAQALWPLLIGAGGAVLGFLGGIFLCKHPICHEFEAVWARLPRARRQAQ